MFNICVISTPRTRSSFFTFSLEAHYNLYNHFEIYDIQNFNSFNPKQQKQVFLEKDLQKKKDLIFDLFKLNQITATQKMFNSNKDYVVKFWTRCLVTKFDRSETNVKNIDDVKDENYTRYIYDLSTYNPKIITNITEVFNLDKYSQYFFLHRDITETLASLFYANLTGMFNITPTTESSNLDQLRKYTEDQKEFYPVTINYNLPRFKFYIFELALNEYLEKYLIEKKLNYIKLDYKDVSNYVSQNFSGSYEKIKYPSKKLISSNFDYKKLILNYGDVEKFVNYYYQECLQRIEELKIKFV